MKFILSILFFSFALCSNLELQGQGKDSLNPIPSLDSLINNKDYGRAIVEYKKAIKLIDTTNNAQKKFYVNFHNQIGHLSHLNKEYINARQYFLIACKYAARNNLDREMVFYLPEICTNYEKLAVEHPEFYKTVKAPAYKWKKVWFTIDSIKKVSKGSYLIDINLPLGCGIQISNSIYWAKYTKGSKRSFINLGRPKFHSSDKDKSTYYLQLYDSTDNAYIPELRDLLELEMPIPYLFDRKMEALFIERNIAFTNNYRESIISFPFLLSKDYGNYLAAIDSSYKMDLVEVYKEYKEDSDSTLQRTLTKGAFKGKSTIEALKNVSNEDLTNFLAFVEEFPNAYVSKHFSLTETFGTWALYGAPMTTNQLSEYLLNTKTQQLHKRFENYKEEIIEENLIDFWFTLSTEHFKNTKLIEALRSIELHNRAANYFHGKHLHYANGQYLKGQILEETNQIQRALIEYSSALSIVDSLGHPKLVKTIKDAIYKLKHYNKIDIVVQNSHSMPFIFEFHNSGKYFYTAGWDGMLKRWDAKQGKLVREISAHSNFIRTLSLSKSGKYIATGGDDGYIKVWDSKTLELIYTRRHNYAINECKFNPSTNELAFCGRTNTIYLLNWKLDKVKTVNIHKNYVTALDFSKDGKYLFSGSYDSFIYKYNLSSKDIDHWYKEKAAIYNITVSPDNTYFAAILSDSTMTFWNQITNKKIHWAKTFFSHNNGFIYYAFPCFSEDNKFFSYINSKGNLSILDLSSLRFRTFINPHNEQITYTNYSPKEPILATVSSSQLYLWDFTNYQLGKSSSIQLRDISTTSTSSVNLRFSPNGKQLISAAVNYGTYSVSSFDLTNAKTKVYHTNMIFSRETYQDNNPYLHLIDWNYNYKRYSLTTQDTVFTCQLKDYKYGSKYIVDTSKNLLYNLHLNGDSNTLSCYDLRNGNKEYTVDLELPYYKNHYSLKFLIQNGLLIMKQDVSIEENIPVKLYLLSPENGKLIDSTIIGKKEVVKSMTRFKHNGLHIGTNKNNYLFDNNKRKPVVKFKNKFKKKTNGFYSTTAFSMDLKHIGTANDKYEFEVWDIRKNKRILYDPDFAWFISDIAFHPTLPIVAVCSEERDIRVYNYKEKKLLFKLFPQTDGNFIAMTKEKFYKSSKQNLQGIAFRKQNNLYPVEQFDLIYNRPDKVLLELPMLDSAYLQAVIAATEKRREKHGKFNHKDVLSLPNVQISNRNEIPSVLNMSEVQLSIESFDFSDKVMKVHISVNGVEEKVIEQDSGLNHWAVIQGVRLSQGQNNIKVWCENSKGLKSLKESISIRCNLQRKQNLYLAVISVSNYKDQSYNLKYAVKDGRDIISSFLKDTSVYENIYIDSIFDNKVTNSSVSNLNSFFSRANVDDVVMIYISGHGLLDSAFNFFYAGHHCDFNTPSNGGIPYSSIEQLLLKCKARKKLLMMDACHSGEVDKASLYESEEVYALGTKGGIKSYNYKGTIVQEEGEKNIGLTNSFELMKEMFGEFSGEGIQVIAAAAGSSFALESDEWENGVFTYALLHALQDKMADRDANGKITVSELRDYTVKEVFRLTKGRQKPTVRQENIEFDFQIWKQ